jgi:hypothetical protein
MKKYRTVDASQADCTCCHGRTGAMIARIISVKKEATETYIFRSSDRGPWHGLSAVENSNVGLSDQSEHGRVLHMGRIRQGLVCTFHGTRAPQMEIMESSVRSLTFLQLSTQGSSSPPHVRVAQGSLLCQL